VGIYLNNDGTTGRHATCAGALSAAGNDFTLMAWLRPESTPASTFYYDCLMLNLEVGASIWNNAGTIRWNIGTNASDYAGTTAITTGAWVHLCLVRSGTTHTLYLNGNVERTMTESYTESATTINLGRFGTSSDVRGVFDGDIAFAKLWDATALTQAQIQQEMASGEPVNHAGLRAWWPLTTSSDTADYSKNGQTLTFSNISGTATQPPAPWRRTRARRTTTTVGVVPQNGYPVSDTTIDNWETNTGGTTNLYQALDETSASDSDYIRTQLSPSSDVYVGRLTSLSTPGSGTRTFRLRAGKDAASGDTISLVAQLRQGYTNEGSQGTLVDTILNNTNLSSGWTQTDFTVTGTVTDYASLYLRLVGNLEATNPSTPVIETGDATESGNDTATSSWSVSRPSANTGDLLIMLVGWDDSTDTTSISLANGPNGETWTQISSVVASNGTEVRMTGYWTKATGSWSSGSITVTPSATESFTACMLKVPSGEFDATTPIGAAATSASASTSSTQVDSPAITVGSSDGGGRLIWAASADSDPQTTLSSGYTAITNTDRGTVSLSVQSRDSAVTNSQSIAAANGTRAIASDSWCSLAFVVRAPSGSTRRAQVSWATLEIPASAGESYNGTAAAKLSVRGAAAATHTGTAAAIGKLAARAATLAAKTVAWQAAGRLAARAAEVGAKTAAGTSAARLAAAGSVAGTAAELRTGASAATLAARAAAVAAKTAAGSVAGKLAARAASAAAKTVAWQAAGRLAARGADVSAKTVPGTSAARIAAWGSVAGGASSETHTGTAAATLALRAAALAAKTATYAAAGTLAARAAAAATHAATASAAGKLAARSAAVATRTAPASAAGKLAVSAVASGTAAEVHSGSAAGRLASRSAAVCAKVSAGTAAARLASRGAATATHSGTAASAGRHALRATSAATHSGGAGCAGRVAIAASCSSLGFGQSVELAADHAMRLDSAGRYATAAQSGRYWRADHAGKITRMDA
jgi:hypothetical protein